MVSYTIDIAAAHNTVKEPDDLVVIPPPEWIEERRKRGEDTDVRWRMKKLLPGRRPAMKLWTEHTSDIRKSLGFERNKAQPHFFLNRRTLNFCEVHADDMHGCGYLNKVIAHLEEMKEKLPVKKSEIFKASDKYAHMKCERHCFGTGTFIRRSPVYVGKVVAQMGLENAKRASTPQLEALTPTLDDKLEPLNEEKKKE